MNHNIIVVGKARKYIDVILAILRYEKDKEVDNGKRDIS